MFSSIVATESGQPDQDSESDAIVSGPVTSEDQEDPPSLEITTTPSGATVYIDFRPVGRTPLEIREIDPGRYRLRIEADGHYPQERSIRIGTDERVVLDIDLEPIVGFLDVDVNPSDARLTADGVELPLFSELPVGTYRLRIQRFGYVEQTRTVTVREDEVTRLAVVLADAPFSLLEAAVDRTIFSPANPGVLGRVAVTYRVSAPGGGELLITDPSGREVERRPVGPFDTWDQQIRWDGTDASGMQVEDGVYQLRLNLAGDDGRQQTRSLSVEIDSTRIVRYRSIWGAAPGLIYAPSGPPLPPAQFQFTAQSAGIITVIDNNVVTRFPTRLGLRSGIGARLELSVTAGLTAASTPIDPRWNVGGAVSWTSSVGVIPGIDTSIGAIATGNLTRPFSDGGFAGPDTQGSPPGVGFLVPASITLGPVTLVVAPEYHLAPAPIWYGSGTRPDNAWTSLANLRLGALADFSELTVGSSLLLRSVVGSGNLMPQLPVNAALEAHWLIPETPLALSLFIASEVEGAESFYVMSGVGLGFLF